MSTTPGLSAWNVNVVTGGTPLVDSIDVEAAAGTITAVVGPNGAGKSSLLAALARIHGTGVVQLDDEDLDGLTRRERARRVALVEQSTEASVDLTVRDAVALGRTPHLGAWGGDDAPDVVSDALEAVGMSSFEHRNLATLSGGERQRVAIGMALAQEPQLLLVDEPSNHLDISAQLAVMTLLRERADAGTTVVVALHDLTLALEHSDHALVLSHGRRIVSGPTDRTLTASLISEVYGVDASILVDPDTGRRALSFAPSASPARDTRIPAREAERTFREVAAV
ncbi:MAG: ABC transporter ATP-binding protein [Microcella sp.]|uniref:ABC transporter ATP-binding protein n=1 Tax=Microcella sp. TaxID=1913979 RepID=UPI003314AD93